MERCSGRRGYTDIEDKGIQVGRGRGGYTDISRGKEKVRRRYGEGMGQGKDLWYLSLMPPSPPQNARLLPRSRRGDKIRAELTI